MITTLALALVLTVGSADSEAAHANTKALAALERWDPGKAVLAAMSKLRSELLDAAAAARDIASVTEDERLRVHATSISDIADTCAADLRTAADLRWLYEEMIADKDRQAVGVLLWHRFFAREWKTDITTLVWIQNKMPEQPVLRKHAWRVASLVDDATLLLTLAVPERKSGDAGHIKTFPSW